MRTTLAAALAAVLVFAGGLSMAGEALKTGDKVDKIESIDETGKAWSAKDILGKKIIVLYFYPADFTGGCTAQACGFRDNFEALGKDVVVIGVSGDKAETHAKFKKHHKLPFTLLADEKGELAKRFAVPVGGGGKAKFDFGGGVVEVFLRDVTTKRHTVVIGKDQTIVAIDAVGDASGDSKRIIKLVEKLK